MKALAILGSEKWASVGTFPCSYLSGRQRVGRAKNLTGRRHTGLHEIQLLFTAMEQPHRLKQLLKYHYCVSLFTVM